jgi:hypothetical protein
MRVSGQRHASATVLPPREGPLIPIVQEAGWTSEPVWKQKRKAKTVPLHDRKALGGEEVELLLFLDLGSRWV